MEAIYRTGIQRFRERYPEYHDNLIYPPLLYEREILGVGTMMVEDVERLEEECGKREV